MAVRAEPSEVDLWSAHGVVNAARTRLQLGVAVLTGSAVGASHASAVGHARQALEPRFWALRGHTQQLSATSARARG